jgi:hypothetical protein
MNSGERIMLSKNTTVLDSISFGFQGADISMARCPDGTGAFIASSTPTYDTWNCGVGIQEINMEHISFSAFPNPANEVVTITCSVNSVLPLQIINLMGDIIVEETIDKTLKINTSAMSQGIYLIKVSNKTLKIVVTH